MSFSFRCEELPLTPPISQDLIAYEENTRRTRHEVLEQQHQEVLALTKSRELLGPH